LGKKIPAWAWIGLLALALVSAVWLLNTAHLGGEIRHEEIQSEEFIQSALDGDRLPRPKNRIRPA
jgi:hypothetical protein